MHRLHHFILACLMGLMATVSTAQSAYKESPVNLAGEQRMLVQRIAKLYSQIGLNILPSVDLKATLKRLKRWWLDQLKLLRDLTD